MTRTFSPQELSEDTGISVDRLEWLTRIGIIKPPEPGRPAVRVARSVNAREPAVR